MAPDKIADGRLPVICADPSSVVGAQIFNPNSWSSDSKGIVYSCLAEFSVLHHCFGQIVAMCKEPKRLCQPQIATVQQQWAAAKFDLSKVILFAEQPDMHIRIEAFFSGVKSLLDLIVQLLSTEKIVAVAIHGFHREKNVYGGLVLNALQNNVPKDRKELAAKIHALLDEHKIKWIDQLINARDLLVHPKRGMHQLMLQFDCAEKDGRLVCARISPPAIDSTPIDQYAGQTLAHAKEFAVAFIALLQEGAISNR
jgi:hypothetical protein